MAEYLKRLQLAEVEELTDHPTEYMKVVNIIEVTDQAGNPLDFNEEIGTVKISPEDLNSCSVGDAVTFSVSVVGGTEWGGPD